MKQNKLIILAIGLAIIMGMANASWAGSFYSSRGIGLVRYFVSGRSTGMGGVGLAVSGPLTVNYLNPATLVALPFTTLSGNFFHESVSLKGKSVDASISDTNVHGVQFMVPIKRNLAVVAIGISPYTVIEYAFHSQGTTGESTFTEFISGDGGVNLAFFSLALKPFSRLSIGVSGLFYFGTLRNAWRLDFESPRLVDTRDEVSRSFTAGGIRGGFLLRLSKAWRVAGVFTPSVNLDANKTVKLRFGRVDDFEGKKIELPLAFGVGTALDVTRKLLVGADVYVEKWSDTNVDGFVNDSKRIAFGIEFSGKGRLESSYFSRAAFRAGIYYRDLGLEEPAGQRVTEIFGTIGIGLPIKWRASRIDLSLEAGRRGSTSSNPIKETVVRVNGTFTVGQRWFLRRKPPR